MCQDPLRDSVTTVRSNRMLVLVNLQFTFREKQSILPTDFQWSITPEKNKQMNFIKYFYYYLLPAD